MYKAYESAFIELAGKESKLLLQDTRKYGLTDKGDSILIYAAILGKWPTRRTSTGAAD